MNFTRFSLSPREKILLALSISLLFLFLASNFIVRQQLPRYRQLRSEVAAREALLEKARRVAAEARTLGERQNDIEREVETLRRRLALDAMEIEGFLKVLQPQEKGLQIYELKPGQVRQEGDLKIQSWQLKLGGLYPSLSSYLKRVETRLPLLQITALKVNLRSGSFPPVVDGELSLELPFFSANVTPPSGPVIALPRQVDIFAPPQELHGPAGEESGLAGGKAKNQDVSPEPPADPGRTTFTRKGSDGVGAGPPSYIFPRR